MSKLQDEIKGITNELVQKCIARYCEQINVLDNDSDFERHCYIRERLCESHIIYKLRCDDGCLYLKGRNGRRYEFLIEFDSNDFAYGIYFGCRCTLNTRDRIAAQIEVCNKEWKSIRHEVINALNCTFVDLDFSNREIPTDNVSDRTYWPFWFRLGEDESVAEVAVLATKIIRNTYRWFFESENYDRIMRNPIEGKKKSGRKKNTAVRTRYTCKDYDHVLSQFSVLSGKGNKIYYDHARLYFEKFLEILQRDKIIERYPLYEKCWVVNDWYNFEFAQLIEEFGKIVKKAKPKGKYSVPWNLFVPIMISANHEPLDEFRKQKDYNAENRFKTKIENIINELEQLKKK